MPPSDSGFDYDAFISYSRKDSGLARRLAAALGRYRPPRGLGLPNRSLRVFRDEADFTGTEYASSLERNLAGSSKLLLLCSPSARESSYVDGEIELFAGLRGPEQIVTALVDGLPNNELEEGVEGPRAFPERLVDLLPVPLAADYRDFDPARDKVDRGRFQASWHKLLADLYQEFGVTRAQIERREERRRRRRRAIVVSVTSSVIVALATLAAWAVFERGKAIRNRNLAVGRQLVAEAELLMVESPTRPELSILLALEAHARESSADADRALRKATAIVPPAVWAGRHDGPVRAASFFPDGSRLVSAGEDGTVRIWSVDSGEETGRVESSSPVRALAVSHGGDRFATGGADGRVELYEAASRREVWSTELREPILQLGFAADGASLVVATREEGSRHLNLPLTVHRLDAADGSGQSFSHPDGVGLDTEGRRLLTFEGLWELGGVEPLVAFEGLGQTYGELVRTAALSADGRLLAIGTRDVDPYAERGAGSLRLYHDGGRREAFRQTFGGGIHALALSRGADRVLTAGEDGTSRVIETAAGGEIWRLSHGGQVRAVAWHPDGELFATAGDDGEVRLYRLRDLDAVWKTEGPPEARFVTLSSNGDRVAALGRDRESETATVWSVGGKELASFRLDPQDQFMEPRPVAFSDGGNLLMLASITGALERRDASTGRLLERQVEEGRPIVLIAVSPDGRHIATGSWDQSVEVSGASEWRVDLSHRPSALAFSADSRRLLAGSEDGRVLSLDSESGEIAAAIEQPVWVTALATGPNGRRLAVGGRDHHARVVDLDSGADLAVIPLGGPPDGLAFVDGGASLRSARLSEDGEIIVETHPLDAGALVRFGCSRLTHNLSLDEWRNFVGAEEYRATCEGKPAPSAGLRQE